MSNSKGKQKAAYKALEDAVKDMLPFFRDQAKVDTFLRVDFPNQVLNNAVLMSSVGCLRPDKRDDASDQEDSDEQEENEDNDEEEEEDSEEEIISPTARRAATVKPSPKSIVKPSPKSIVKPSPKSILKTSPKTQPVQPETPTPLRRKTIGTPGSKGTAHQFAAQLGQSVMEMPTASPSGGGKKRQLTGFDDVPAKKKKKASPVTMKR